MQYAIEVSGLKKTYPGKPPVEAVRGIDLQVPRGECFGVLGPNGAGKTTTIEILEGLMPPTAGEVSVLGLKWASDGQKIREQIGVSLQETQMSDKLSVGEVVSMFRSFYKDGLAPSRAIELVGLQEKTKAWVKKLSGGQKQRLAVACAIVGSPQLLFLDEPTTGLDPTNRRQLWEIINRFKEDGRTIMLTTHYMEEAERLCDQVAIVDQGKIITQGSPRELISSLGAEHVIEVKFIDEQGAVSRSDLENLPGVRQVDNDKDGYSLSVQHPHETLPHIVSLVADRQVGLTGLSTRSVSLEDVFISLTGRHLSDEVLDDLSVDSEVPNKDAANQRTGSARDGDSP